MFFSGRSKGARLAKDASFVGTGPHGSVADPGVCALADFLPAAMSIAERMPLMMNRTTGASVVRIRMQPGFEGDSGAPCTLRQRCCPAILIHCLPAGAASKCAACGIG